VVVLITRFCTRVDREGRNPCRFFIEMVEVVGDREIEQ
jgi:hypothetical protein